MSDDNNQVLDARRRRVRRLKKCIIVSIIVGITMPLVMCIALLVRVHRLSGTLEDMTRQMQELTEVVMKQQEQLGELTAELVVTGQGSSVTNEAQRESEGLTAEVMWEQTEISELQKDEASHKVYLTFDDGPSIYTDDILDILDRYGVKATFFVVGKETDSAKKSMQDIVERGHTLGMHSYSHKYNEIYESVESFAEDFTKLRNYLYEVTGVECKFYRFPGGSSNTVSRPDVREFAMYLEQQGIRFYDWNIASGDGGRELLSVETLTENSLQGIEEFGTSIILMHDSANKRTTVEALPIIIENILAMEDTVILPITEDTEPVQHIH